MDELVVALMRWQESEGGQRRLDDPGPYQRVHDRLRQIEAAQRQLEEIPLPKVSPVHPEARPPAEDAGFSPPFEARRDDMQLLDALEGIREAVQRHPIAARAIFASLAAEGQRYAATTSGAALASRLSGSPRFARARHAWAASTSWLLEGADVDVALPRTLIDALVIAAEREDMPVLLEQSATARRRK